MLKFDHILINLNCLAIRFETKAKVRYLPWLRVGMEQFGKISGILKMQ